MLWLVANLPARIFDLIFIVSSFLGLAAEYRHRLRHMVRDATVYVRGRIRHDDHATIRLYGWHRVYLNGEFTTGRVAFYD